jgi:hypothetical protein
MVGSTVGDLDETIIQEMPLQQEAQSSSVEGERCLDTLKKRKKSKKSKCSHWIHCKANKENIKTKHHGSYFTYFFLFLRK